jgi:uncharacterized protein YjbI with pentapeptide repeats
MDKDQAVAMLREGRIAEWNEWRSRGEAVPSLQRSDLRGADLRWANLTRVDLRGADLSGADLSGAYLNWADLRGADLRGADLREAEIRRAVLRGADLREADLSGADLNWANLGEADLRGVDLRGAEIGRALLGGAYLSGAYLSEAGLHWAHFIGADLSGAYLSEAGLRGAEIGRAEIRGADLREARLRLAQFDVDDLSGADAATHSEVGEAGLACLVGEDRLSYYSQAVRRITTRTRRAAPFIVGLVSRKPRFADPVDCTVFAPPSVTRDDWLSVQVYAHRPDQREEAKRLAREIDRQARRRGFKSLAVTIERGTTLRFHIQVPGFKFATPTESLFWQGRPDYVHFTAQCPSEVPIGSVIGKVTVSRDSLPIASIMFKLEIVEKREAYRGPTLPVGDKVRRYKNAFISYASKDRPEVLKRVQMLRLARIRYFQDVLKLEPGDRWEKKLFRHIDRCDLFLLFWSTSAKGSEWVLKEARYAMNRKGGDDLAPPDLIPVIIEGPPVPEPPEDLAHLHFNDYLIYFTARHGQES